MSEVSIDIEIKNEADFLAAINRAKQVNSDLRVPLTLIAKDFYKSEQAIFNLKGKGQYQDLSAAYKKEKMREVGFIYPILFKTGALAASLTSPNSEGSINEIINKDTLVIGTSISYGIFHQSRAPRSKIPYRPFLFIGAEAPQFANSEQLGRKGRWLNILNAFVLRNMKAELGD